MIIRVCDHCMAAANGCDRLSYDVSYHGIYDPSFSAPLAGVSYKLLSCVIFILL